MTYTNKKDNRHYELRKGYELLAEGTLDEIAEKMKVKRESIVFMKYPTYQKRLENSENRRYLICMDDLEDEEE